MMKASEQGLGGQRWIGVMQCPELTLRYHDQRGGELAMPTRLLSAV
ncbi:MAG TPA: hypothetical protein VKA66_13865 [Mycobacterium sp.]|nr:hypothetical protein [Mycobacterium sp.]HKI41439.1 hypothetical protein [Mycobacterium sp.]